MTDSAPNISTDDTEHNLEVGQDNVQVLGLDIHNPVFFISAIVIIGFVIVTLIFRDSVGPALGGLRVWLTSTFDWLFLIAGNLFVLFCLALVVSPVGKVRIGGAEAVPDYGYLGWFAMLFAAGMGIGLMFFGVLEPMYHFNNPPLGLASPIGADGAIVPEAVDAAREAAMAATIFHWGLHPWAIYAVVALALAYSHFRKGLPLAIRSALFPRIRDRIYGRWGDLVDIIAVFALSFLHL